MVRIPEFQRRIIPSATPIDTGEAGVIGATGTLLATAAQIGAKFKQINDTTKANELSNQFQLEAFDDFEAFKKERAESPDNLAKDFGKLLKVKKEAFIKSSNISPSSKSSLSRILGNASTRFDINAKQEENQMKVLNFGSSIERAADLNYKLAFRSGKALDFGALGIIENNIKTNLIAGSTLVGPNELAKMQVVQTKNAIGEFIKGIANENPRLAIETLDTNKPINDRLSTKEIDALKRYALSIERRRIALGDDPTISNKSASKAARSIEEEIRLDSEFDKFAITKSRKTGKFRVKNRSFNSIRDLIAFRQDVKRSFSNETLTNRSKYIKYLSDTTTPMMEMLRVGATGTSFSPFSKTVNEQLTDSIKDSFGKKGNRNEFGLSDADFVQLYEDTIIETERDGIDPKSVKIEDKAKMQKVLNRKIKAMQSLRSGVDTTNMTLINGNLGPLNSEASSSVGSKLDNGGFKIVRQNGLLWEVQLDKNGDPVKDKNGNVLARRRK